MIEACPLLLGGCKDCSIPECGSDSGWLSSLECSTGLGWNVSMDIYVLLLSTLKVTSHPPAMAVSCATSRRQRVKANAPMHSLYFVCNFE